MSKAITFVGGTHDGYTLGGIPPFTVANHIYSLGIFGLIARVAFHMNVCSFRDWPGWSH